jgi:hypothetical protein
MPAICYFCHMIRKLFLSAVFIGMSTVLALPQAFVRTADLFNRPGDNSSAVKLNINQNPAIDSLISRYILISKKTYKDATYYGMEGFRIQIYGSSNRNAREESNKARAEFMNKFPDIVSYPKFADPGYFKIRVGDFRTRTEAMKLFLIISKEFPNSFIVRDIINFPDQINK